MKIFLLSTLAHTADAKIALNEVSRKLTGEWINDFYNYPASKVERFKREIAEGEKGFRPLAAMMLYMQVALYFLHLFYYFFIRESFVERKTRKTALNLTQSSLRLKTSTRRMAATAG